MPLVSRKGILAIAAVIDVALNARGYRWQPHKNKYGREYPTNAGRERY